MDHSTDEALRAYERSLKELRQDMGCTVERIMECPELVAALRRRLAQKNAPASLRACVEELRGLVQTLSDPKYREPLLVALRFNDQYTQHTLTERRTRYNEDLKHSPDPQRRKYRVDSLRTLERRENEGIEQVSRLLMESDPLLDIAATSKRSTDLRNGEFGLATHAISYTCRFSKTGSIVRNDVRVWLKALTPDAGQEVTTEYRYYSESRPGVLTISPIFGCDIVHTDENTAGGVFAKLQILKSLQPDDGVYVFGYSVNVRSEARAEPLLRWKPLTDHTERIEFHLIFDPAMIPRRAWWFRTASDTEGQLEPVDQDDERHLDVLDDGRYIYKIFSSPLAPLLHYGVAWAW